MLHFNLGPCLIRQSSTRIQLLSRLLGRFDFYVTQHLGVHRCFCVVCVRVRFISVRGKILI